MSNTSTNKADRFYNPVEVLSKFYPFNFIMGNRSIGKTFGWSYYCLMSFIKHRKQFIWLRRYESDIAEIAPTWADNVSQKPTLRDHAITCDMSTIKVDGEVAGYFFSVSKAHKLKSISLPKVDTIIYDEFLSDSGRYIGGQSNPLLEPELCASIYTSIAREYGKPVKDVRFVFLANAISIVNPYFTYFDIDKYINPDTRKLRLDGIYVDIVYNDAIADEIMQSAFGRVISKTRYGRHMLSNEFLLDNNEFVMHERPKGRGGYILNLAYQDVVYAVWLYSENGYYYITTSGIDKTRTTIALSGEDHKTNYIMIMNYKKAFKQLKEAYSMAAVRFDSIKSKKFFESVIGGL